MPIPFFNGKCQFQIRSTNFETNPNVPNPKDFFNSFELLDFEFVSDFDIRISDFFKHPLGLSAGPR